MKYLIDLTNNKETNYTYNGNAGLKHGVLIDNEPWLIKITSSFSNETAINEFIASHVYQMLGLKTHETILAKFNNQLVVACKDFTYEDKEFIDYLKLKNVHSDELQEQIYKLHQSLPKYENSNIPQSSTPIEDIIVNLKYNKILKQIPELTNHFWKMFIIDCLLNNYERTNKNWGIIINKQSKVKSIVPIFDNGASFVEKKYCYFCINSGLYNYQDFIKILSDKKLDGDFNNQLIKLIPIIKDKMPDIINFINNIPNSDGDIEIISNEKKNELINLISNRLNTILLPIYNKLKY